MRGAGLTAVLVMCGHSCGCTSFVVRKRYDYVVRQLAQLGATPFQMLVEVELIAQQDRRRDRASRS